MRRVMLIVILLALTGCAGLSLQEPEVHLVDLRLGATEGLSQLLEVDLVIVNPNRMALQLDAVRYQLHIEGFRLVSGTSTVPLTVPAGGEAHYTVPARVNLLAGVDLLRMLMSRPLHSLSYRLDAELEPHRGWRSWRVQRRDTFHLSP